MFTSIFLLSFLVIFLVYIRIKHYLGFGKDFLNLFLFLLFMVLINFFCIFSKNLVISLVLLVFLSFYSMFLILYGYGLGFKVVLVVFFKSLADVFVILILSNFYFYNLDFNFTSYVFNNFYLNIFLVIVFLVYSLFGIFGFWIFWAMEASYFISCFMHSCGFISVGFVFIIKISFLGYMSNLGFFISFINFISLFSYLLFLFLFFITKDCKKSFGFYSASSVCFLMFTSVNYPFIAISYFFLSSVIKILIFESLSFVNKVNFFNFIVLFLFIFNIFLYSLFFILNSNLLFFFKELVYIFFIIKIVSVVSFAFKIFNIVDLIKPLKFSFYRFFILIFLFLNKFVLGYLSFNSLLFLYFSYLLIFIVFFRFSFFNFRFFKKILDNFVFCLNKLLKSLILFFNMSFFNFFIRNCFILSILNSKYQANNNHLYLYVLFFIISIFLFL